MVAKKLSPWLFPFAVLLLGFSCWVSGQHQEAGECGFQFQVCHQSTALLLIELWLLALSLDLSLLVCIRETLFRVTSCPGLPGAEGFLGHGTLGACLG